MSRLSRYHERDVRAMLGLWEKKIKTGEFDSSKFLSWTESLSRKFKEDEGKIRSIIRSNKEIMSQLGGTLPSYSRTPPRKSGGCCGG